MPRQKMTLTLHMPAPHPLPLCLLVASTVLLLAGPAEAYEIAYSCGNRSGLPPWCDPYSRAPSVCEHLVIAHQGRRYETLCTAECREVLTGPPCEEACIIPSVSTCFQVCADPERCPPWPCYPAGVHCPCADRFSLACTKSVLIIPPFLPQPPQQKPNYTWVYITCGIVGTSLIVIGLVVCCARTSPKPTIIFSRSRSLTAIDDGTAASRLYHHQPAVPQTRGATPSSIPLFSTNTSTQQPYRAPRYN